MEQNIYRLSKEKAQEEIKNKISTIELHIISEIFHHTESVLLEFNKVSHALDGISGYALKPDDLKTLSDQDLQQISEKLISQISRLLDLRTQLSLATYQIQLLIHSSGDVQALIERFQNREFLSTTFVYQKIPAALNPHDLWDGVYVSVPVSSIAAIGERAVDVMGWTQPVILIAAFAYDIGSSLYNIYKNHKIKKKLKRAEQLWTDLQINHHEFVDMIVAEVQKKISPLKDVYLQALQNSQGYLVQKQRFYQLINQHLRTLLLQLQSIQTQLPKRNLIREIKNLKEKKMERERRLFYVRYRQDLRTTVTLYALARQEMKYRPSDPKLVYQTLQYESRFHALVSSLEAWNTFFNFSDAELLQIKQDVLTHRAFLKDVQSREK